MLLFRQSATENTPHTWTRSGACSFGSNTTLSTFAYTATRSLACAMRPAPTTITAPRTTRIVFRMNDLLRKGRALCGFVNSLDEVVRVAEQLPRFLEGHRLQRVPERKPPLL